MSRKPVVEIREAEEGDLVCVSAFMRAEGQVRCSQPYLHHWYFRNPVPGGSLTIGVQEGKVVGMATTTAHTFARDSGRARVAMPQKVLTHASLRGQGIFGRLYRECEASSVRRGTEFFLTVTNAASTDIFLEKFGYSRLPSPQVTCMLPLPGSAQTRTLGATDTPLASVGAGTAWRMSKDHAHIVWRYIDHPLEEYVSVRCSRGEDPIGDLFLRRTHKKGVPLLLLMDMTASDRAHFPALIRMARKIAWQQRCLALLCLVEERFTDALTRNGPVVRRSSGFNFLVRGKDPAATAQLAQQPFEISFGDLDFF